MSILDRFFIKGGKAFRKDMKTSVNGDLKRKQKLANAIAKDIKADPALAKALGVPAAAPAAVVRQAADAAAAAVVDAGAAPVAMSASLLRPDVMSILGAPAFAHLGQYKPHPIVRPPGGLPDMKGVKALTGLSNSKALLAVDPGVCQRRVVARLQARQAAKSAARAAYVEGTKSIPDGLVCARNRTTQAYLEVHGKAAVLANSDPQCAQRVAARKLANKAAADAYTEAYQAARMVEQVPAFLRCSEVSVFQ